MARQDPESKAAARRDRNSDSNHLGMDTVAAGMAAAGLGLAILQQDVSEAKAESMRERGHESAAPVQAERSGEEQAHMSPVQDIGAADTRTETADAAQHADAPMQNAALVSADPVASSVHGDDAVLGSAGQPLDMALSQQPASTLDTASASQAAAPASGLQGLMSSASSTVNDIAHAIEHQLDAFTASATEAIGSSLQAMTDTLSTLTSRLGDVVTDHAASSVQATAHLVDDLAGNVASSVPAIVDPIFHDAFGPASDAHAGVSEIVDTGGLASFGMTALDAPISFLGQSYTDVADQSVHGLHGLTHGLI